MTPLSRSIARLVLAAALSLTAGSSIALAQAPAEPGAEESSGGGGAFNGYFGTFLIAGLGLFIICRTARR